MEDKSYNEIASNAAAPMQGFLDAHKLSITSTNPAQQYVSKKTQRIVLAIVAVTRGADLSDTAISGLRRAALSLLDAAHELSGSSLVSTYLIKQALRRVSDYLEVVVVAGSLSPVNATIINTECLALEQYVDTDALQRGVLLEQGLFTVTAPAAITPAGVIKDNNIYKGHSNVLYNHTPAKTVTERAAPSVSTAKQTSSVRVAEGGDRAEQILSFIRSGSAGKEGLSVRDLLSVVPGVSEKTIQRELLALVASGKLKKEGERRWSRYLAI